MFISVNTASEPQYKVVDTSNLIEFLGSEEFLDLVADTYQNDFLGFEEEDEAFSNVFIIWDLAEGKEIDTRGLTIGEPYKTYEVKGLVNFKGV